MVLPKASIVEITNKMRVQALYNPYTHRRFCYVLTQPIQEHLEILPVMPYTVIVVLLFAVVYGWSGHPA